MDRNFLYSMVALLAFANVTIYIQKTNPSFFSRFFPQTEAKSDSWIKEDPGWRNNQDFPQSETPPPRVDPIPPKADPVPPRVQPQQPTPPRVQPQDPFRRQPFRRNDNCPGCRPG